MSKQILHVLTFLYSVGLLILLFFRPKGQSYGTINLIPFDTIHFYLSGNVAYLIALYNLGRKYWFIYTIWIVLPIYEEDTCFETVAYHHHMFHKHN